MVETGIIGVDIDEIHRLRAIEKAARAYHDFLWKVITSGEDSPVKIVCDDIYAQAVQDRLQALKDSLVVPPIKDPVNDFR